MKTPTEDIPMQARVLGNYLIHRPLNAHVVELYEVAMTRLLEGAITPQHDKVLTLALQHPRLLRILDAGSALVAPNNTLRQRLYILLAIIEATPDYSALFLPRSTGPLHIIIIGLHGIAAVAYTVAGVALVKLVGIAK